MGEDFKFWVVTLLLLLLWMAVAGILILAQIEDHLAFIASHTH
jgi:hypothetical protein